MFNITEKCCSILRESWIFSGAGAGNRAVAQLNNLSRDALQKNFSEI